MESDYPAAHSMDTRFFAIDRDGHVACFDTGEAGAVPVDAVMGEDADLLERQLASLPHVAVIFERAGRATPGRPNEFNEHRGRLSGDYPTIVFLDSLDPVRDEIATGRAEEVRASEGVAVLFRTMSDELAARLHDSGACLGCSWYFAALEGEYLTQDLTELGVYSYSHLTENWISGPYGRVRRPERPVHVDQLPPRLRDALKAVRFDAVSFAEALHLQPVEHAVCESWEPAYLDVTGTHIRPIPGKEEEYARSYPELASIGGEDRVQVEPPPPGHEPEPDEG